MAGAILSDFRDWIGSISWNIIHFWKQREKKVMLSSLKFNKALSNKPPESYSDPFNYLRFFVTHLPQFNSNLLHVSLSGRCVIPRETKMLLNSFYVFLRERFFFDSYLVIHSLALAWTFFLTVHALLLCYTKKGRVKINGVTEMVPSKG